jgi:hypothetical protein
MIAQVSIGIPLALAAVTTSSLVVTAVPFAGLIGALLPWRTSAARR